MSFGDAFHCQTALNGLFVRQVHICPFALTAKKIIHKKMRAVLAVHFALKP